MMRAKRSLSLGVWLVLCAWCAVGCGSSNGAEGDGGGGEGASGGTGGGGQTSSPTAARNCSAILQCTANASLTCSNVGCSTRTETTNGRSKSTRSCSALDGTISCSATSCVIDGVASGTAACNGDAACALDWGGGVDACSAPATPPSSCDDGERNGGESDVDCGGACSTKCPEGAYCVTAADCESDTCTSARCAPPPPPEPTCDDEQSNGGESDVDCGGSTDCPRCGDGRVCEEGADCASGNCRDGECTAAPRAVEVAAGSGHTCALFDDGQVKCWGENMSGRLGVGDSDDRAYEAGLGANLPAVDLGRDARATAIAVAEAHSCALLEDGGVKCWGGNDSGQLGLGHDESIGDDPDELGDALPRVDLGTGRSALSIAAGSDVTCALLDDRSVKCWGGNNDGQLGSDDGESRGDEAGEMGDDLAPIALDAAAIRVSVGATHVCAVVEGGSVRCWGSNFSGELGGDDDESEVAIVAVDLGVAKATDVAAGAGSTCAVLEGDGLVCWGSNWTGQLGRGSTEDRSDFDVPLSEDPPIDLGDGLVASQVRVGGLDGSGHTCVLLDGGGVRCWGANGKGQLGLGDADDRGDEAGEMGEDLPAVELGQGATVISLAAGEEHSCAVLDDGTVKCWGSNFSGQLGIGDYDDLGDDPEEMGDALPTALLW